MKNLYLFDSQGKCFMRTTCDTNQINYLVQTYSAASFALSDLTYSPKMVTNSGGALVVTNPVPTDKEIQTQLTNAVQQFMDQTAQAKGYDSILSACSYSGFPNIFQTEGQEFLVWRANVWQYCYQVLDQVKVGTIPIPSATTLISELPQFTG